MAQVTIVHSSRANFIVNRMHQVGWLIQAEDTLMGQNYIGFSVGERDMLYRFYLHQVEPYEIFHLVFGHTTMDKVFKKWHLLEVFPDVGQKGFLLPADDQAIKLSETSIDFTQMRTRPTSDRALQTLEESLQLLRKVTDQLFINPTMTSLQQQSELRQDVMNFLLRAY